MSENEQTNTNTDGAQVVEGYAATLTREDGTVEQVYGQEAKEWFEQGVQPPAHGVPAGEVLNEGTEQEVKGPDPEVWGDDADRPTAGSDPTAGGVPIGEVINEGTPDEVKGPGPEWEGRHA